MLIVIVGLGFFFLILINIQMYTMSFNHFLLQNFHLFIFNTGTPAPLFFLGYTLGGAAALSATLLTAVMDWSRNIKSPVMVPVAQW